MHSHLDSDLLELWVGVACSSLSWSWLARPDERRETDDGAGRNAEADANEEHHGICQHQEGVLHLHTEHHTGGRRPHTGKHRIYEYTSVVVGMIFFCFCILFFPGFLFLFHFGVAVIHRLDCV